MVYKIGDIVRARDLLVPDKIHIAVVAGIDGHFPWSDVYLRIGNYEWRAFVSQLQPASPLEQLAVSTDWRYEN